MSVKKKTGRPRSLPSPTAQRRALKKQGIETKGLKDWTVYRRYNYYITRGHSLDEPFQVAYGQKKKLISRIEQQPEIVLTTARGKRITGKEYARMTEEPSEKEAEATIEREFGKNMTYTPSHMTMMKRKQDVIRLRFYKKASEENPHIDTPEEVLIKFADDHVPLIIDIINKVALIRGFKREDTRIATQMKFEITKDDGDSFEFHPSVKYITYYAEDKKFDPFFAEELNRTLAEGFNLCLMYANSTSELFYIDIIFSSKSRATRFEELTDRPTRINRFHHRKKKDNME